MQPLEILDCHKSGANAACYFHGLELKLSTLRFIAFPLESNSYLVAIDLYLPKRLKNEHQHKTVGIIYIIIEKILGEKAFANEIHSVNICEVEEEVNAVPMPLFMLAGSLFQQFQSFAGK